VRITAQLINVANGYHLWSERYDREMKDIFEVQDEIARAIAGRLEVALAGGPQQTLVKAATKNLEAYQLCLKGRALLFQRGPGIAHASECFKQAANLDPDYAVAWAGLAYTYNLLAYYGYVKPQVNLLEAKEAAMRAVALDPTLSEAHSALGCIHFLQEWEWSKTEREFRRALELNPHNIHTLGWYAWGYNLSVEGRSEEAVSIAKKAAEYDPLSGYALSMLAAAYSVSGRGDEAVRAASAAVELQGTYVTYWVLANILHWHGQFEGAVAAGETALGLSGRHAWAMASLAMTYADWGKVADAQAIYAELLARAARGYMQPTQMAIAATAAADTEKALAHTHEAFELRDPCLTWANYWPDLARLREEPRFTEILVGMGLK